MRAKIPAVVLGATGYVGGELLRLIAGHPQLELAAAVSESCSGQPVTNTFPHLHAYAGHCFSGHDDWLDGIADGADLAVFSAAPHGASAALIARTLGAAIRRKMTLRIVDSSADFRYRNRQEYEAIYGCAHGAPELLDAFDCVLPEHAAAVDATHIGHPGCFATAVLLATVPLLQSGLTEPEMFVTATTGSTGSGRSPQAGTHHPERHSNLYAYKPLAHRHTPEISNLCKRASGRENRINFVPHSGPFARGIYATVQAKVSAGANSRQLLAAFNDAYADAPFVHVADTPPKLKQVVASNYCHIGLTVQDDTVVVMSALDNLVKGAAGGAVQWMNRLWQLPETSGLLQAAPAWT